MKVEGLWFNKADKVKMLRRIRENIPLKDQEAVMPVLKDALNASGGKGLGGEWNSTVTVESNGYQVIADVCCGNSANVVINKIATILP